MRERDRDWYQEKTDEVSGFQQSSTFDTRPLLRQAPKRRPKRSRARPPLAVLLLLGIVMILMALVMIWFKRA